MLSFALYLGGGLLGVIGFAMFALSYGWRARLYRTQWDYRFTGLVLALLAALAVGAGWYEARR